VSTTPFPFDSTSTAGEVLDGVDLTGRRAVVTGGASGLGRETARVLALAGAEVTLAVRNTTAGEEAAAAITSELAAAGAAGGESAAAGRVLVAPLDLSSQQSVREFVAAWQGPLHMLVDNAGVMATPELRTPEGWELQFATNHLGHFALTTGLYDALAAAGDARVVVVSSRGHLNGPVLFDDVNFEHHPYDRWAAYSQSKTANVLFAVEAAKRWAPAGISVNALAPGRVRTGLLRHIGDETNAAVPAKFEATNPEISWQTVEQGAATSVLLAASPVVAGVTGQYFEQGSPAEVAVPGELKGVASYALDATNAARLWQLSLDLLGEKN
jgi:NAD(P)-dependent dehydrogenase (short-subunit alcohol dehydrogenase family)